MGDQFNTVMDKVEHSWDWDSWSAEDLIRELCTEKDAAKLLEQMKTNRGRFRTQPMKGLLLEWGDFRGVWLEHLPLFVSLLPKGEKTERFRALCQDPENLRKINLERERVRMEQGEKARKLLSQMEDFDPEDVPWEFREHLR